MSFNSLARFAHCLYGLHVLLVVSSIYVHVAHARVEFLMEELTLAHVEVHSSSVV